MTNIPDKCPACSGSLATTQLTCIDCGTEVHGQFETDIFAQLSPTDYDFVVMFVMTKGNIKEMERELGISYWTIRSKLSAIIDILAASSHGSRVRMSIAEKRQAVLQKLNNGEITVDEAAEQLEALRNP